MYYENGHPRDHKYNTYALDMIRSKLDEIDTIDGLYDLFTSANYSSMNTKEVILLYHFTLDRILVLLVMDPYRYMQDSIDVICDILIYIVETEFTCSTLPIDDYSFRLSEEYTEARHYIRPTIEYLYNSRESRNEFYIPHFLISDVMNYYMDIVFNNSYIKYDNNNQDYLDFNWDALNASVISDILVDENLQRQIYDAFIVYTIFIIMERFSFLPESLRFRDLSKMVGDLNVRSWY